MKYASVCSGVEAASLAWIPLGWEAAWFSEIEPFPCAVLKERFPSVPNLGDMTKIRVENLQNGDQKYYGADGTNVIIPGGVELLVGGTPCQSWSVAGKREGLEGQSGLAKAFVELLGSIRPRWFVWENVPGCLSSRNKQTGVYDFNFLLAAFAERGYSCGWKILDAQFCRVDGLPRAVPQRRRRVFVVGHLGGWEYPAEVLFEPTSLSGNTPPRRIKGKGFTTDAERSVGTASTFRSSSHGEIKKSDTAGSIKCNIASAGNSSATFVINNNDCGSENLATIMNQNQVAATLDMHYGDKQGLENQHINAGCPNFVIEKHEQIVCVHGAETPIHNTEGFGNPVTANHNGLENVICYDNQTRARNPEPSGNLCSTLQAFMGAGGGNLPLVQECYYPSQHHTPKHSETVTLTTNNCATIRGDSPLVQESYSVDHRNQILTEDDAVPCDVCGIKPDVYGRWRGEYTVACDHCIEKDTITAASEHEAVRLWNERNTRFSSAVAIAENIIGRQVQNGGNGIGAQEELAYTQNTSGVMGICTKGCDVYNHKDTGDVATTLTANSGEPNTAGPKVMSQATVRRLLPIECERLMGFPDNWTRISWKGKPEEDCPDSPRYKACGNSMCVNVMRWIGMRIENVERKTRK